MGMGLAVDSALAGGVLEVDPGDEGPGAVDDAEDDEDEDRRRDGELDEGDAP